ncbi:MAG: DUF4097 family beta strand repeat protein [Acidobacteria bacterium]|nr:DUF4097 family beta strand repeat protein [Acidobacteriota bacterium]
MGSPQQPPIDPRYYRPYRFYRPRSIAGPIVLVAIGVAFLLANMRVISPGQIAWLFATWWPLLLILLGLIRIGEYAIARSQGEPAPHFGGGAVAIVIFVLLVGLTASSARHWNWRAINDNVDVNPGWDGIFGDRYDFNQEMTQALPVGGRVQIFSDHGSVTVHVTDNGDAPVKLVVHRHISASSQEEAQKFNDREKPAMTLDGNTLHINPGQNEPHVQVGFVWGPRFVSDMEVWAPRKAAVQIDTARGDVVVSDRDADVNVTTAYSGDIQVSQVKGNVEVACRKGDVHINNVTGDVHVNGKADDVTLADISGVAILDGEFFGDTKLSHIGKSVKFHSTRTDMELGKLEGDLDMDSGDLHATSVGGPLEVHTRAKDIRLEDVSGPITIENSHGEIDLRPRSPFGDVNVSNHSGPIHITVPENAGFTVDARSSRGELESDFDLKVTKTGEDHVAEGTVGKGGNKLQLTTDHGTIEIRKG